MLFVLILIASLILYKQHIVFDYLGNMLLSQLTTFFELFTIINNTMMNIFILEVKH